jgi:magnesium transporter
VITCRLYRDGVLEHKDVDPADISDLLHEDGALVWLDVERPEERDLQMLQEEFALHPLSVEDALHWNQRPKVEVFANYFTVVLHAFVHENGESVDSEVHAFVGKEFLVTLRSDPPFALDRVIARWDSQPELTASGGGAFLLYALLDVIVDGHLTAIETFEDEADAVEDRVFGDEDDVEVQHDLFHLKREIVGFRRVVMPHREVINLIGEQPGFVPAELVPYYRDVLDHVIRTIEFADNVRDLLTSALDAQLSQASNRLNVVMKKLSSWAAIVLVPTLIAGIYGMNFRHMPELDWRLGYPMSLALMAGSALLLYRSFKKRDWL